ncbi:MAG TPA: GNAT family N-acetyltransferase [Solirubrobacteraceae bacterium]|nr:GNAT family N-acetyltransferase [Solirubrobacteraceae bacterium]
MDAWPATVTSRTADGWVLRATPGLDRARSNNALTPCRELVAAELPAAIASVESFARRYGIHAGIQVSPVSLHGQLMRELDRRGWGKRWPVLVLAADRDEKVWAEPGLDAMPSLERADHATPEWLSAWARCEPGRDAEAHARTVFGDLAGRAKFARLDDAAVGIAVDHDDLVGLFCLAVDPARRRSGLGTSLVRALLAGAAASTAYLQVEEDNTPAVALYERLGFAEAYRYCHRLAPG